jgi:hypothetical protein
LEYPCGGFADTLAHHPGSLGKHIAVGFIR